MRTPSAAAARRRELLNRLKRSGVAMAGTAKQTVVVVRAPGRTELGGNHTDHQHGRVLAAAVEADIMAAAVRTDDRIVTLSSPDYPRPITVDLSDTRRRRREERTTAALVRGIAHFLGGADRRLAGRARPPGGFRAKVGGFRAKVGGFRAEIDSCLPQGMGLSSSAAIELLIAALFNELYLGGSLTPVELARISQRAENEYYGKPCGLMDQIASACGGVLAIDFKIPDRPMIESIDFEPERAGYALFLVSTGGDHSGLTAAYAAIPAEMRAVAARFKKKTLREVDAWRFLKNLASLRRQTGDRALLRALHFFKENERVAAQAACLKRGDVEVFLKHVHASGDSSWELLQNCLPPGGGGSQGIALGLALSRTFIDAHGGRGAARVHGGGFEGTVQCYVPLAAAQAFQAFMEPVFGKGSVIRLRLCARGTVRMM